MPEYFSEDFPGIAPKPTHNVWAFIEDPKRKVYPLYTGLTEENKDIWNPRDPKYMANRFLRA